MNQGHDSLETQFEAFLESNGLVSRGNTIVLAVSGGIDSMVLLHLFSNLSPRWSLRLVVAHVNHQLRGDESIGDEEFVQQCAEKLKIPVFIGRMDTLGYAHTNRISKQEAARALRYEFFEQVRRKTDADAVATAHQADDNAETVLLNALRGAGIRGLAGIPVRREAGRIIRPLLFARRTDINQFAEEHHIAYRLDSSNKSVEYRRNYLRHNVIPVLEASSHFDFVRSINRLSGLLRQLDDLLSAEVERNLAGVIGENDSGELSLNITALRSRPELLQERIVLEVLRRLGSEVESDKVNRVLDLCELTTGSQLQLSKDLHVYRDRDQLNFVQPRGERPLHESLSLGQSYDLEDYRFSLSLPLPRPDSLSSTRAVEFVDAGKLGEHLLLRSWQPGDWFVPLGMNARKKISDYFIDEKVPLLQKRRIPIFESEGEIVWICGKRLDDRFKVTDQTRRVVRLEFSPTISIHENRLYNNGRRDHH